MNTIVVRYQCKPDRADENQSLIEAVFAELATNDPGGLSYASFRLDDNTFVHIARTGDDNPLANTEAFKRFQAELGDRCVEGPNPQPATLVGSYNFDLTRQS